MAKVVVVGGLSVDLVVRASHIPAPGEIVLGSDFNRFLAGKGANQAVAAAQQDGYVTLHRSNWAR